VKTYEYRFARPAPLFLVPPYFLGFALHGFGLEEVGMRDDECGDSQSPREDRGKRNILDPIAKVFRAFFPKKLDQMRPSDWVWFLLNDLPGAIALLYLIFVLIWIFYK
jgi:hypothetical protein